MRKVRDVLRLKHTLGMSLRQISEATGVGKTVVGEYVRRAGVIGITWPVPEEIDDAELERRLFPVPCETGPPRRGDRLAQGPRGDEAAQRDAGAAVAGVPRGAGGRLRLQPLLRSLWRMAQDHLGDDAPDASGRGEAVRRLCRRHGAGVRSDNECGASGPHLRRRARSVQLHLCGGALVGGARPTGSARTSTPSRRSAACRRWWSATI